MKKNNESAIFYKCAGCDSLLSSSVCIEICQSCSAGKKMACLEAMNSSNTITKGVCMMCQQRGFHAEARLLRQPEIMMTA